MNNEKVEIPNDLPDHYAHLFTTFSNAITSAVINRPKGRNSKAAIGEALLPMINGTHSICSDPNFLPAFLAYLGMAVYDMEVALAKDVIKQLGLHIDAMDTIDLQSAIH